MIRCLTADLMRLSWNSANEATILRDSIIRAGNTAYQFLMTAAGFVSRSDSGEQLWQRPSLKRSVRTKWPISIGLGPGMTIRA